METELLKSVGQVAGIGGLALGVVFLVFREIIRKSGDGKNQAQTTKLLTIIAISTTVIGLAGIGAWVWTEKTTTASSNPPPSSVSATNGSVAAGKDITAPVTVGAPAAPQPPAPPAPTTPPAGSVSADNGSVAAGGSISGSVTVGAPAQKTH